MVEGAGNVGHLFCGGVHGEGYGEVFEEGCPFWGVVAACEVEVAAHEAVPQEAFDFPGSGQLEEQLVVGEVE